MPSGWVVGHLCDMGRREGTSGRVESESGVDNRVSKAPHPQDLSMEILVDGARPMDDVGVRVVRGEQRV